MLYTEPLPLGVMSRRNWRKVRWRYPPFAWTEIRTQDLLNAVFRYRAAGIEPPPEWDEELRDILREELRLP